VEWPSCLPTALLVRICANEVVAGVRLGAFPLHLPSYRHASVRFSTANLPEGLALARAWGFESRLPHQFQIQLVASSGRNCL
jgi:hypothetical protein